MCDTWYTFTEYTVITFDVMVGLSGVLYKHESTSIVYVAHIMDAHV